MSGETIREYQRVLIKDEIMGKLWIIPVVILFVYFLVIKKVALVVTVVVLSHTIFWICSFACAFNIKQRGCFLLFFVFLFGAYSFGVNGKILLAIVVLLINLYAAMIILSFNAAFRRRPIRDYIDWLKFLKSPREYLEREFIRNSWMMFDRVAEDRLVYIVRNGAREKRFFPRQKLAKFKKYEDLFFEDLKKLAQAETESRLGIIKMRGEDIILEPNFKNFECPIIG